MSQFPSPSDKPLPSVPQSPIAAPSSSSSTQSEDENNVTLLPSADSSVQLYMTTTSDSTTQRNYALLELLDSERKYASDLILIREYQIPLASGRLSSISSILAAPDSENAIHCYPGLATSQVTHAVPPGASALASRPRPLTTASEASALSLDSIFTLRPMKTKDINIVFGNIEDLAAFSERFLYELESALGEFIEGNEGQDYIGRFFLDFIPEMESLYSTYIMNQPHALEHYHLLSQTFQFDVYHPRSQILAHKSSKAWDLPSLLIKPVQRLLHYPSLLAALIAATPDSHADKANLVEAHSRMGELARGLDGWWRQQKVVQDALAGARLGDTQHASHEASKATKKLKGGMKVGLAASVNLGRIIRLAMEKRLMMEAQTMAVKAMGERLRRYRPFMTQLARMMVHWADTMRNVFVALAEWAQSFGRVIWMDPGEARSDVFQALLALIGQLLVASDGLRTKIKEKVLRVIGPLQGTMEYPVFLLDAMQAFEPFHYGPLHVYVAMHMAGVAPFKPYIVVRAKLLAELPTYLKLLDRGISMCILRFSRIQRRFYGKVHVQWTKLGDYLQPKRRANQGAEETLRVWSRRYSPVEAQMTSLGIAWRPGQRPTAVPAEPCTESSSEEGMDEGVQAPPSVSLASLLVSIQESRNPQFQAPSIRGPSQTSTPYYVTQLIETPNTLKLRSTPLAPFPPTLIHPRTNIVLTSSVTTTSLSSRTHPDMDNGITSRSDSEESMSDLDTMRRDGNKQKSGRRNSRSDRWATDETSDTLQVHEVVLQSPSPKRHVRFENRLLRFSVVEEESEEAASNRHDLDCAHNMDIPNNDEGDVPPKKRGVRFKAPLADSESDASKLAEATPTSYVDHGPGALTTASAKSCTRLLHHPPSQAPFVNTRPDVAAYNQRQSAAANASFGTRLVGESPHSALRRALTM